MQAPSTSKRRAKRPPACSRQRPLAPAGVAMSDEDLHASVAAGRQAVSTGQMARAWARHFLPLMVDIMYMLTQRPGQPAGAAAAQQAGAHRQLAGHLFLYLFKNRLYALLQWVVDRLQMVAVVSDDTSQPAQPLYTSPGSLLLAGEGAQPGQQQAGLLQGAVPGASLLTPAPSADSADYQMGHTHSTAGSFSAISSPGAGDGRQPPAGGHPSAGSAASSRAAAAAALLAAGSAASSPASFRPTAGPPLPLQQQHPQQYPPQQQQQPSPAAATAAGALGPQPQVVLVNGVPMLVQQHQQQPGAAHMAAAAAAPPGGALLSPFAAHGPPFAQAAGPAAQLGSSLPARAPEPPAAPAHPAQYPQQQWQPPPPAHPAPLSPPPPSPPRDAAAAAAAAARQAFSLSIRRSLEAAAAAGAPAPGSPGRLGAQAGAGPWQQQPPALPSRAAPHGQRASSSRPSPAASPQRGPDGGGHAGARLQHASSPALLRSDSVATQAASSDVGLLADQASALSGSTSHSAPGQGLARIPTITTVGRGPSDQSLGSLGSAGRAAERSGSLGSTGSTSRSAPEALLAALRQGQGQGALAVLPGAAAPLAQEQGRLASEDLAASAAFVTAAEALQGAGSLGSTSELSRAGSLAASGGGRAGSWSVRPAGGGGGGGGGAGAGSAAQEAVVRQLTGDSAAAAAAGLPSGAQLPRRQPSLPPGLDTPTALAEQPPMTSQLLPAGPRDGRGPGTVEGPEPSERPAAGAGGGAGFTPAFREASAFWHAAAAHAHQQQQAAAHSWWRGFVGGALLAVLLAALLHWAAARLSTSA